MPRHHGAVNLQYHSRSKENNSIVHELTNVAVGKNLIIKVVKAKLVTLSKWSQFWVS